MTTITVTEELAAMFQTPVKFRDDAGAAFEMLAQAHHEMTVRNASLVTGTPSVDLVDVDQPDTWQDRGLCAQTDPEAFFPEKGGSTREAKKMCQGCPVISECLEYALANDERFGIWGGLSERERRKLKKDQATTPATETGR